MSRTMATLSAARRSRMHRTSAASFLASLESSCSLEELAQIDWSSLVKVPHWCVADRRVSNQLQLTCGTVFLAPLIAQWVDGNRLKQARALVGAKLFDESMRAGAAGVGTDMIDNGQPVPELLASAGASVLVGAIDHPVIRKLLSEQFPMSVEPIDESIAKSVYQLALATIDALQADGMQGDEPMSPELESEVSPTNSQTNNVKL